MSPTIQASDYVVALKCGQRYQKNDLVLLNHTEFGIIIKRIVQQKDTGEILLAGDNPDMSIGSSHLGWQSAKSLLGKVIFHIPHPR